MNEEVWWAKFFFKVGVAVLSFILLLIITLSLVGNEHADNRSVGAKNYNTCVATIGPRGYESHDVIAICTRSIN